VLLPVSPGCDQAGLIEVRLADPGYWHPSDV
jgi:hypothetical protein